VVALDFRAEHSIPTESFQAHFDQTTNDGFRLVSITGFDDADGNIFFNTIWHRNTASIAWRGYAGIPQNDYQAILDENIAQGFRPIFVDGFSANGIPYICAIYHLEDNPPFWSSRDLQSSSEYQQYYENMLSQGYSLDVISSYQVYGSLRIVSLFSQHTANDSDDWVARHGLTASEYEAAFDQFVGQGYSLEHVSAGTIDNDEPRFATIFSRGPSNENGQFVAFRGIAEADIQTSLDTWISKGYVPKVIDCYRSGNDLRWALLLTKNPEPPVEPTTSPSNAPLPISIGPSTPPSNAPASSSPTTSPSDYRVAASNWPSSQPFADPVETPATARPTTATSDDKIHDMKPLSSPPTVSPLGDLQSGAGEAGGSSTQSKCRMYVAILVLSLTAFLLL